METDARRVLAANLERLLRYSKDQRKLRQRHGPTTAVELEEKSGVGDSTISRYRKQEAAANIDDISRIALAYGLQPWELLYPKLDPAAPPATRPAASVNDVLKAAHDLYVRQGGVNARGADETGGAVGDHAHRVVPGKQPPRKGAR